MLYSISLLEERNRIAAFYSAESDCEALCSAHIPYIWGGSVMRSQLLGDAGHLHGWISELYKASPRKPGHGPNPPPLNTTVAVQLETKHMTSVWALGDQRTGADSMNLPHAVHFSFLHCHWLQSSPQTLPNTEHPDYWNTSVWIMITTLKLQGSILVLLLIATLGAEGRQHASTSTMQ